MWLYHEQYCEIKQVERRAINSERVPRYFIREESINNAVCSMLTHTERDVVASSRNFFFPLPNVYEQPAGETSVYVILS